MECVTIRFIGDSRAYLLVAGRIISNLSAHVYTIYLAQLLGNSGPKKESMRVWMIAGSLLRSERLDRMIGKPLVSIVVE